MEIQMTSSILAKWEAEEEQEEGFYSWTEPAVAIPLLEPSVKKFVVILYFELNSGFKPCLFRQS